MINHQNMNQMSQIGMPQPSQMGQTPAMYPSTQMSSAGMPNPQFQGFGPLTGSTQLKPDGPSIPARVFVSEDNIRPNEVPADGTPSLFMQSDYSCIYAQAVNRRGTIDIVKYVPEKVEQQNTEQTAAPMVDLSPIMAELETIKKALYKKNYHKPYNKSNNRPEVAEREV